MRHLLTDPAFPDLVAEWAEQESRAGVDRSERANDNDIRPEELPDPLLPLFAKAEIAATRLW